MLLESRSTVRPPGREVGPDLQFHLNGRRAAPDHRSAEWWRERRMNRTVRRKLEMAVRVRDFSSAHPSTDANYAPVLARLEERIVRMETLAKQQEGGFLAKRSSVVRRQA